MIRHVTFGTHDLPRAAAFHGAQLAECLGARRIMEFDRGYAWGSSMSAPAPGVMKPGDGQPATRGKGCTVAFVLDSRDKGDRMHARALALGGTHAGAPGLRGEGFDAAYFRDPDGNKLHG